MNELATAAHGYADLGWHVFILGPKKAPVGNCGIRRPDGGTDCAHGCATPEAMDDCPCLTCHGFHAATRDHPRITAMLERHPRGLLAIRTGHQSGLVVVDVDFTDPDDPQDIAWQTIHGHRDAGNLPPTLTAITGSGGHHYLYAHPGPHIKITSGAGKLGPKVDSKADGGYIVAAPSLHPRTRRPYRWAANHLPDPADMTDLPAALLERLREHTPTPATPAQRDQAVRDTRRYAEGRLTGALTYLLDSPTGERNTRLHWAACRAGELVADGLIPELTAARAVEIAGQALGLGDTEVRLTVASGLRAGRNRRRAQEAS